MLVSERVAFDNIMSYIWYINISYVGGVYSLTLQMSFLPFQLVYHQQTPQINRINGYSLSFLCFERRTHITEHSLFYQGAQAKRKKLLGSTVGSVNRKAAAKLARHLWRFWGNKSIVMFPQQFQQSTSELPGINRLYHLLEAMQLRPSEFWLRTKLPSDDLQFDIPLPMKFPNMIFCKRWLNLKAKHGLTRGVIWI